jgi:hypothetical protein
MLSAQLAAVQTNTIIKNERVTMDHYCKPLTFWFGA